MRTTLYWSAAVTVACMVIAARAPLDEGSFPIRMPSGERADPPRGLTAMCDTQPDQCDSLQRVQARGDTQPAPAEKDRLKLLTTVNRQVNGGVRQVTDARAFGQGEVWRRSGTGRNAMGDCEDIALEKMYRLALQGYPSRDMFLAVGYAREVGLHTVLIGRTERGDFVLDNRTPYLIPWNKAPYRWIVHQEPGVLTQWRNVSGGPRQEMVERGDKRPGKRALRRGAATVG